MEKIRVPDMMPPTLFCCRAGLDVLSSAGLLVSASKPCQENPIGPLNQTPASSFYDGVELFTRPDGRSYMS